MGIVDANKDNFKSEVLDYEGTVLVDFNATWCGPCKMLKPVLEEIALEQDKNKIVAVDVDNEAELAKEYGVLSIPCLVLFKNGKEVKRSVGLVSKSELENMLGGK